MPSVPWTSLFKRLKFFARFEHFLKLDILCKDEADNVGWKSVITNNYMKMLCDDLWNDIKAIRGAAEL